MADPSKQQRLVIHLDGGLVQAVYATGGQDLSEVFAEILVVDTDTDGAPDEELDVLILLERLAYPSLGPREIGAFIRRATILPLPDDSDLSDLLVAWDAKQ